MKSLCSGAEFRSGARIKLIGFAAIAALMFAGCHGGTQSATPMSKGEISKIVSAPKSYKVVVDTSAVQAGDDEWKKMGEADVKEFIDDIQKEVGDSLEYDELSPDVVVNVEVKNIQRQSVGRLNLQGVKSLWLWAGVADIPEMTSSVSLKTKEGDEIEKFESKIVSGWHTPLRVATSGHGWGSGTSHEVYEDFGQMVKEKLTELKNIVIGRK